MKTWLTLPLKDETFKADEWEEYKSFSQRQVLGSASLVPTCIRVACVDVGTLVDGLGPAFLTLSRILVMGRFRGLLGGEVWAWL